jgi:hypothetical protein
LTPQPKQEAIDQHSNEHAEGADLIAASITERCAESDVLQNWKRKPMVGSTEDLWG